MMDATEFLAPKHKVAWHPLFVVYADEDFLKRQAIQKLLTQFVEDADPDIAVAKHLGDQAEFSEIRNELETLPFLANRRIIVIDQAEPFLKNYRAQVEAYLSNPAKSGVLILDLKSFPSNTKLYKLVPDAAAVNCKAPPAYSLGNWAIKWAKECYDKVLTKPAAQLLMELVGPQMGVLDQELRKLTDYVGEESTIQPRDVDLLVGKSSQESVFQILDAIGDGQVDEALRRLTVRLEEGDEPLAILGALGFSLRRAVQVAREYEIDRNINTAMDRVGIPNFPEAREKMRKLLKHLGASRINKIYDWLIEADLGMKGDNPLPDSLVMQRLILRLGRVKVG